MVTGFKYQEIFALSQALPGPASTKMVFCINYIHGGLLAGIFAFSLWW
jgi:chromate transport protein ChrA